MKSILALAMFGALVVAAAPVLAADTAATPNSQQSKMTACNKKAGDMKGDERKDFMSKCLSAEAAPAKMTQQEKMTACNKKAGGMKGDERKTFMSTCLTG